MGRAARAGVHRPGARAPGAGDVAFVDGAGRTHRRACPSWPGSRCGSTPGRRSSTGSWSSSARTGWPTATSWRGGSRASAGRPVAYLAFDLLHLDGRSLLSAPLIRRREALRTVLRPGDEVVAVPAIAGEGRALHEAAATQGIAGVMARQRTSPYLPGVRSRLWRFVPTLAPAERPRRRPSRSRRGNRGRVGAGRRADPAAAAALRGLVRSRAALLVGLVMVMAACAGPGRPDRRRRTSRLP